MANESKKNDKRKKLGQITDASIVVTIHSFTKKEVLWHIIQFSQHKTIKGVPQEGESRGETCGLHNFELVSPSQ